MTFALRLAILIALLALLAGIDLYRNRGAARKWREYVLLLSGGAIGALFGTINDVFITSRLSPEYFIHGKGIEPGGGFQSRVAILGMQAGLAPGIIGMGLFLYLNSIQPTKPQLPLGRLALETWKPLVAAAALGAVTPLLFAGRDPLNHRTTLAPLMTPDATADFLRCWWTHIGIYAGCLVGLAWAGVSIYRKRRGAPSG